MPTVLNLDEVLCERTTITKTVGGQTRTWSLRDDIPTEVMLLCFSLMDHVNERSDLATAPGVAERDAQAVLRELATRLAAQVEETLDVCLAIWQHTYPETTRDELRVWFTHGEREQMVQLFFFRRLVGSSAPSSAITATMEQVADQAAQAQQQATEAATATATTRRRSPSGGIPSQKRLSRQLNGRS